MMDEIAAIEPSRDDREMAALVIATLLRIRQEMDNRDVRQNPRRELELRREMAAAAEVRRGGEGSD